VDSDGRALYIISVAAQLAGVHPQTLRIYERKGLIEPQRTQGRSRRYSERDIALLQHIQELTQAGVGLSGVERILELEQQLAEARSRIADLEAQVAAGISAISDAVERTRHEHRRELVPLPRGTLVRLRMPARDAEREQT
jgi:MerR family transcriptional regulator, heat shock protein HspR